MLVCTAWYRRTISYRAELNMPVQSGIANLVPTHTGNHLIGDEILQLAEDEVAPEDVVFHRFYMNKTNSSKKPKAKRKKAAQDDEDADDLLLDASDDSEEEEIDNMLGSGPLPMEDADGDYDYDDLDKVADEDDDDLLGNEPKGVLVYSAKRGGRPTQLPFSPLPAQRNFNLISEDRRGTNDSNSEKGRTYNTTPLFATTAARSSPSFGLICDFGIGKERCLRPRMAPGPITHMADGLSRTARRGGVGAGLVPNHHKKSGCGHRLVSLPHARLATKRPKNPKIGVKATKFCILIRTLGAQIRHTGCASPPQIKSPPNRKFCFYELKSVEFCRLILTRRAKRLGSGHRHLPVGLPCVSLATKCPKNKFLLRNP
ncbi:hypothetical protein GW17_00038010 [Ensete ventricosum]|nr:hypothetical protein GW17_00038010 [Ensete ventricosum]